MGVRDSSGSPEAQIIPWPADSSHRCLWTTPAAFEKFLDCG